MGQIKNQIVILRCLMATIKKLRSGQKMFEKMLVKSYRTTFRQSDNTCILSGCRISPN